MAILTVQQVISYRIQKNWMKIRDLL